MDWSLNIERLASGIRDARKARGLTQEALARRAGVKRLMLIRIEKGDTSVSIAGVARVVAALGLEMVAEPARLPTLEELDTVFRDDD